jgi:hypothetical protein
MRKSLFLSLPILLLAVSGHSQTTNLLQNPNADEGVNHWRAYGNAIAEEDPDSRVGFVVRNGG